LPEISGGGRRLFWLVVLAALAVRIAYLVDISDSPYFDHPVLDSFWYDTRADQVVAGDLLASTGIFRVPLYIYLLAASRFLFGPGYVAPLVIQAFLGALACGLV
jgi:hypothetical protein